MDIAVNGPQEKQQLVDQLQALYRACDEQPFGRPEPLGRTARQVADWSLKLAGQNANENAKPAHAQLLRQLCAQRPNAYPDYDSARQIAAAILTGLAGALFSPASRGYLAVENAGRHAEVFAVAPATS